VTQELLKKAALSSMKDDIPAFKIGDTVNVSVRIIEGDKERTQVFTGAVIARRGSGVSETFTVRRIVNNQGVERVFPIHSPKVAGVEVVRGGKVRRAKLYYLRDRIGKATRLKEIRRKAKPVEQNPRRRDCGKRGVGLCGPSGVDRTRTWAGGANNSHCASSSGAGSGYSLETTGVPPVRST
jgi:large subunit ribosomal protein L19